MRAAAKTFLSAVICCNALLMRAQVAGTPADTAVRVIHHHKLYADFHYPGSEYFVQGQVILGAIAVGGKITAGYRLGQFGIIGGGAGVVGAAGYLLSRPQNTDPYGGVYVPIFAHYEGDILRKPILPFYAVEAGYTARYANPNNNNSYITVTPLNNPVYHYYGGFTGAFDFGVKVYTPSHVYVTFTGGLEVLQNLDKYSNYYYNSIGEDIKVSYSSTAFLLVPNIKIGCGF